MTFKPSPYQQAIFDWIRDGSGNAIVNAVAGSGKTTTLQQAAKLLPADKSAIFIAFNNHIVEELKKRLAGTSMVASTVHSAGRAAIAKIVKVQGEPDKKKYNKIVKALLEKRRTDSSYDTIMAINKLVDQARNNLTDVHNAEALHLLALRFDLEEEVDDWMYPVVRQALEEGDTVARNAGLIDFTDMIYLPVRWNLTPAQADIVFGDEIQDWNAAQTELICRMVKERFLGVGDPRQSIMAFAGADDQSFWKIKARLTCTEFPLSVSYRCAKSHISLAKDYVQHIEAATTAIDGTVTYAKETDLFKLVKTGDLILCRKTAPLVKNCIALIGQGVAAKVRGRNVGKTLTDLAKTVSKMTDFTVEKFPKFLEEYEQAQVRFLAQKEDSEEQIEDLRDRVAALDASFRRYYEKHIGFEAILSQIEALFSDDNPGVWLSTIHRAKGLEAERVMILEYDSLPLMWKNQQPYQYAQEENLVYVALTRAKKELIIFGEAPKAKQELLPLPTSLTDGLSSLRKILEAAVEYGKTVTEPVDPLAELKVLKASPGLIQFDEPRGKPSESPRTVKPHPVPHWDEFTRRFEINMMLARYGKLTDAQKARLAMLHGKPVSLTQVELTAAA